MIIDETFISRVRELELELKNKYPRDYLENIGLEDILQISHFIDQKKPVSHFREYKYDIINYLKTFCDSEAQIAEPQITVLKNKYLENLLILLVDKYGFIRKGISLFIYIFLGILLDSCCLVFGFSKIYFYFPLFTSLNLIYFFHKKRKKKREGKLIGL